MKIVAVNGSHKGRNGNTDIMVTAFLKGARAAGAQTAHILLAEKEIKYCRACKSCWFRTPGQCVLKDDMAEILPVLADADLWVWATPLYFDNISSRFKTFIDRLMVLGSPHWTTDEAGECRHLTVKPVPKLMIIANCGFPEHSQFQVIGHWLQRHARNLGAEVVGEIYASEGALLGSPNEEFKPITADYLSVLETAGREAATALRLSKETTERLGQPLIPAGVYIEGLKAYLNGMLRGKP